MTKTTSSVLNTDTWNLEVGHVADVCYFPTIDELWTSAFVEPSINLNTGPYVIARLRVKAIKPQPAQS